MRADSRRTQPSEQESKDSSFDHESIAEDWNVQLLGGLPREDSEEPTEARVPSPERAAPPGPVGR